MNNFILSFIFLICLIFYYILVGSFFLTKIKIEKNKFAVYVIVGWLITFTLGWITGFPAQLNSKSWSYFANHFQIALIIVGLVSLVGNLIIYKNRIICLYKKFMKRPIIFIKPLFKHLKKYWFVYLFVGIFTWFSITNLQPYTLNNYNDDHYIVKMLQNFRVNSLLKYDVTGNLLHSYQKYGYARQYTHHMFNTYEIVYSYFAYLFNINTVAFARFTMTIHNYLLWFLTYQLLGSIFFDEYNSQYTIVFFSLLLIPEGYVARGISFFHIRIFENWRNQTAIYMGSSIVRNLSFPLLLYFTNLICESKKIRILFIFPIIFITLLSYQTTSISYLLFYLPLLLLVGIFCFISKYLSFDRRNIKKSIISLSVLAVTFTIALIFICDFDAFIKQKGEINIGRFSKVISSWYTISKGINIRTLTKMYNSYLPYYNNVFKLDTFAKIAPIVIVCVIILSTNRNGRITATLILFIYLIFKLNRDRLTLSLISFEYYGTARMLHSMILLVIFMNGVFIELLLNFILRKTDLSLKYSDAIAIIGICIIVGTSSYIVLNEKNIENYNLEGDGIIKSGYSMKPIIENDKMTPEFAVEIGQYFNRLYANKVVVFSFDKLNFHGESYTNQCLLLSSNKIATAAINYDAYKLAIKNKDRVSINEMKLQSDANYLLNQYCKGKIAYGVGKDKINRSNINYAVFTEERYVNKLLAQKWKIVFGNSKKGYWILKK